MEGLNLSFDFPEGLSRKYQPRQLGEFLGLERVQAMLSAFADKPYPSAWFFLGPSGTGKTTLAQALAEAISAETIEIPSGDCNAATVDDICRRCHYMPWLGKRLWLVAVHEADRMTPAAQLAFLSKLDSTSFPPNTVFVFTANDTQLLQDRFLSRCRVLKFERPTAKQIAAWLSVIWQNEKPGLPAPDLEAIAWACDRNLRDALMRLEMEMLAPGSGEPDVPCLPIPEPGPIIQATPVDPLAQRTRETLRKGLFQ